MFDRLFSEPPNALSSTMNEVTSPSYWSASKAMPSLSFGSAFMAAWASVMTSCGVVGGVLIRSLRYHRPSTLRKNGQEYCLPWKVPVDHMAALKALCGQLTGARTPPAAHLAG